MPKTAIVTGGVRGLGAAMALRLAKMGYNVAVNYCSDSSRALAEELIQKMTEKL